MSRPDGRYGDRIPALALAALLLAGSGAAAQAPEAHDHGDGGPEAQEWSGPVPLYDDLGDHHHPITTFAAEAQAYFDQGLRLQYAFNHAEAVRAYEAALARDPGCAMCWWGIALANGPNINAAMDSASGARAYEAIRKATERTGGATAAERALIAALAERYGPEPLADRAARDSAYARAMGEVAARFPDDPDALTLRAAALMNLSPWDYWIGYYGEREPRPGTDDILASLERALSLDPENPGACHYYIHAVEAAYPERAVDCAEGLAARMPGAGHIVHMPGHIYIRVGRYADAVEMNRHAVHADEAYIADQRPGGLYPAAYYPHNYHFMAFAATMAGMSETALSAARTVAPKVPPEIAKQIYWIQNVLVLPQLTQVSFGRWEEVLEAEVPPEELSTGAGMARYARGIALAALGRRDEAEAELAEVRRLAGEAAAATGEPNLILDIAVLMLEGEIALRSGEPAAAAARFRTAAELEDGMLYEEPPLWYYPVRHSLGRALLEAGDPVAAEIAYREDLARFPDNGWSLFGLAESLEARGKAAEAAEVRERFRKAWRDADVELEASRF